MASTFECPKCGRELKVPDELLGKKVKCPACQSVFITAVEESSAPPPAPRPSEGIVESGRAPRTTEEPEPAVDEPPPKRPRRWEDDYEGEDYARRRGSRRYYQRAMDSVNGPAIALMVTGIIGVVLCMVAIALNVLGMGLASAQAGARNNEAMANVFSGTVGIAQAILGAAISGLIIFGTIKMRKLESYGLAMTVSILAMIPCISPCCLLGIPFGIWSIVVLNQPHVKDAFR